MFNDKRILVVYPYNKRSNSIESVLAQMRRSCRALLFVSQERPGPLFSKLESIGVHCRLANLGEFRYRDFISLFRYILFLNKSVKQFQPQIIIAHQQFSFLTVYAAILCKGIPIYYFRHNSDADLKSYGLKGAILNSLCNVLAKFPVAPSSQVARYWRSEKFMRTKNIRVIPYLYEFTAYEDAANNWCAFSEENSPSRNEKRIRILSFNRLQLSKRVDQLLHLIFLLNQKGVNAELINFGDGEERKTLESMISEMGLKTRIYLEKFNDNPYRYFKGAHFFVLMSESEASNSSVKEACFFGVPVVVKHGVGDFSDYLSNTSYCRLLGSAAPVEEAADFIVSYLENHKTNLTRHTDLKRAVLDKYSKDLFDTVYKDMIG